MNRRFLLSALVLTILLSLAAPARHGTAKERILSTTEEYDELPPHHPRQYKNARDEVLGQRDRRKRNMRNMVTSLSRKLSDHGAGEIDLSEEERKEIEMRLEVYQRRLDLLDREMDEKEIEREIMLVERRAAGKEEQHRRKARARSENMYKYRHSNKREL